MVTVCSRRLIQDRIAAPGRKSLISVLLPLAKADERHFRAAIDSVRAQWYPHWELRVALDTLASPAALRVLEQCKAQDARIHVVRRVAGGTLAGLLGQALRIASGDMVVPLGTDALLAAQALYRVSETLEQHPEAQLVYSDEDHIDARSRRHTLCFKCRWNPDLFLSVNMVGNLLALRTGLARQVGGVRAEFEGAHDYDLLLRCVECLQPSQIVHIPQVLYHRRSAVGQRHTSPEVLQAGARAINEHLARTNVAAVAEIQPNGTYRVCYRLPDNPPLVSLIIPTRNAFKLLLACIASVRQYTGYPRYEILIVDNGTDDPDALAYLDRLRDRPNIRVLRDPRPFNYSALNNGAIAQARGEVIGLLNNDVEVISASWLRTMVRIALQSGVGAVGARLWYPDGTLQHGGVVLGYGGGAGHAYKRLRPGDTGNQGRAAVMQGYSAVTAACLVVRKDRLLEVGGFNEANLPVTFNDVDLCLKLRERGYRNVWTPFAELYHWESALRGEEDTVEKRVRFAKELAYLRTR